MTYNRKEEFIEGDTYEKQAFNLDFGFLSYLDARFYWYRSFQKEHQDANKVVKVGILQFVTHDALDQIEKGIEDGLKEAGYKGTRLKSPS